jgi:O-antigen/teichoic acid export membrane protein
MLAAGSLLGNAALGAIKMAQNILGLVNIILLSLENHFPVKLAKLYHQNSTIAFNQYLMGFYKKYLLVSGAMLFFLLLFSSPLITLLFGKSFTQYQFVLHGFMLIYLIVIITSPLRIALRIINKQHIIFAGYIASTLFSLFTANYLVSHYGVIGVLVGLGISQIFLLIACYVGFIGFSISINPQTTLRRWFGSFFPFWQ